MANTYTARFIACTNPTSATSKTFFTLFNAVGSTNVVRVTRAWIVNTNLTTAAGGTTGYADYVMDKFVSSAAPGGGAAVGLINHYSSDPFWPTATTSVITGTAWATSVATFYTTATGAATVTAVTATTASPFSSTVTTSGAHGFTAGQNVALAGMTPSGFNGTYRVLSVPTTTTFVIKITGNPGTATVFGTATGGHSYQIGQNVVVTGVTSSGGGSGGTYNGTWQIASVPAHNQFTTTAVMNVNPGTWSSGGTIAPAITALLGNTAITGTFFSVGNLIQVSKSNWHTVASTTLVTAATLQTLYSLNCIWDTGYGDTNMEPIILRGGEGLRLYNIATPNGTWPTTAATFDIVLELTIT